MKAFFKAELVSSSTLSLLLFTDYSILVVEIEKFTALLQISNFIIAKFNDPILFKTRTQAGHLTRSNKLQCVLNI